MTAIKMKLFNVLNALKKLVEKLFLVSMLKEKMEFPSISLILHNHLIKHLK